ncbi:MAG: hypothetical protein HC859_10950 [Bacteroidia bacterium]|nr:hypothetical protein [Bacteroidia bacterium]
MKFLDFKAHFEPFVVFSTSDIYKWNQRFDTRRLVEWQEKGYIQKVINRWYVFSRSITQEELMLIANRVYSPSYVSMEWALSYYGLIPEGVYTVTGVSSRKTNVFHTPLGTFSYKHLKRELFFGYRLIKVREQTYKIAEPEKLILDFLYLNPRLNTNEDLEGLRLNRETLSEIVSHDRLMKYVKLFENKALERRLHLLTEFLVHHA